MFGIFVTAVEPGMFRTDWAGRSMVRSNRHIADYDAIFEPIREARLSRDGKQPGDPGPTSCTTGPLTRRRALRRAPRE